MLSAKFKVNPDVIEDAMREEAKDNCPDLYPTTMHRYPYLAHHHDGTSTVKAENQAIMSLIGKLTTMGEGGLIRVSECGYKMRPQIKGGRKRKVKK